MISLGLVGPAMCPYPAWPEKNKILQQNVNKKRRFSRELDFLKFWEGTLISFFGFWVMVVVLVWTKKLLQARTKKDTKKAYKKTCQLHKYIDMCCGLTLTSGCFLLVCLCACLLLLLLVVFIIVVHCCCCCCCYCCC